MKCNVNKKICIGCNRLRKIGKFGNKTKSSDGKNPYCRDCMRIITSNYKSSLKGSISQKKSVNKYKAKNVEKIKEYNKDYYIKNKARILYNKRCREDTECVMIFDEPEKKIRKKKINKDNKKYIIEIDPKRKI